MPCPFFRPFPLFGAALGLHHGLLVALAIACLSGPTSALAQSARVSGLVTDPDGRVVAGARILVARDGLLLTTAGTDRTGRFAIDGLDAGRYELRVAFEGFLADVVSLELAGNEARAVEMPLRLSAFSESIVVSSGHVERPRSRVADSLTVITARDLAAHQVETVADALRLVPGLAVTSNGGRGGLTSLFPRGGESDFTLVLIDGVRVNAFGGGYDFAHLPAADIERIEVVRGPQSAVYGSDAIGGVVHIVTRHGGASRVETVIEGGGFGTSRLALQTSGEHGPWRWGAGAEQLDSDGYTGRAPATGEPVTNDDYLRRDLSASGSWRRGMDTDVRGNVRLGTNERGVPGPFGLDPGGTFGGVDRVSRGENQTRLVSVGLRHRWTPRIGQQVDIAHTRFDGDFLSPFGESFSETRRLSLRAQTDVTIRPRLDLSAGIDIDRERGGSTFITGSDFSPIPVRRRVAGYYGELRARPHDRVSIALGLRLEQIHRDALEGHARLFVPRPAFPAQSETVANPKTAVEVYLRPPGADVRNWTRLRVSAGTGIRPPDGLELAFTDNADLRSERSRSIDIGIEQALAGGAALVDATAFFSRYDDLIVAVGPSLRDASRFSTDNIANSRARGLEVSAAAQAPWGLGLRASYTWMDTEILAVDGLAGRAPLPFEVGDPLLRRPRHQGAIDAIVVRPRVSAFVRIGARGNVVDVDPSFGAFGGLYRAAGYGVMDVGASVRLWKGIELRGRIDNVLDRAYEEALGFPALGRSATVGVRLASR